MQPSDNKKKNTIGNLIRLSIGRIQHFPRIHLALAGTLATGLSLLLLLPSNNVEAKRHQQSLSLALPVTNTTPASIEEATALTTSWHHEKVLPGDNLSLIFQRAGLSDGKLFAFMAGNSKTKTLKRIHPGHILSFDIDNEGQLQQLRYRQDRLNSTLFQRQEDGFSAATETRQPDIHTAYRQATISSSLFLAAQQVQMDANLIMELANIFGWDIDFALDIRSGDNFQVLYEEKFLDGEKIGNGNILSARFTNQGKTFTAIRYTDSKGISHYYTPEGDTMRKEFLRTPIDFARISSHFNLRRKHPVLNRIRAHKGTDYAAPRGTPIKAAGDGKVVHAGRKGGYGNTVIIQHGQTYKTLYAHMKNFGRGVRSGKRVKQGQIIGYVGTTGLSTGPHLHYEFYVNGAVRNPVTVKLPKAKSIAKAERERFFIESKPVLAKLESFHQQTLLALAPTSTTTDGTDNINGSTP